MNLFETVKASVSVPEAARRYGIEASRHGMAKCPFHNDRHPSLKLNRDYYYCFGCGASGDVVDLVARLFGLMPYEAAKKIVEDFGLDPDKPPTAAALAKPKHPMIKAIRDDERYCQRVLCDYLHLLEDWKVRYAPCSPEDELDDRFVEACQMHDYIEFLADVLTVGDITHRAGIVKELMKDGKMHEIENRLERIRLEERRDAGYGKEKHLAE